MKTNWELKQILRRTSLGIYQQHRAPQVKGLSDDNFKLISVNFSLKFSHWNHYIQSRGCSYDIPYTGKMPRNFHQKISLSTALKFLGFP